MAITNAKTGRLGSTMDHHSFEEVVAGVGSEFFPLYWLLGNWSATVVYAVVLVGLMTSIFRILLPSRIGCWIRIALCEGLLNTMLLPWHLVAIMTNNTSRSIAYVLQQSHLMAHLQPIHGTEWERIVYFLRARERGTSLPAAEY